MIPNNRITKLLKVLQFDFDDINLIYKETLKDPYIEAGFEYDKKYPYNIDTIKSDNEKIETQQRLIQLNDEKLYGRIFNFTQTFNAFKGLLIGIYPEQKPIIEKFFSNKKFDPITRDKIGNDLKHDPQKDLEYNSNVDKVHFRTKKGMTYSITNKGKTWFYDYIDSVLLCKVLFNDLEIFLKKHDFIH